LVGFWRGMKVESLVSVNRTLLLNAWVGSSQGPRISLDVPGDKILAGIRQMAGVACALRRDSGRCGQEMGVE
jgi:hypothetical protein